MERPKTERKIIIHIEEGISETNAICKVSGVIAKGRVSTENGRQTFCFATTFQDSIVVSCRATSDTTDTFHVWKKR